MTITEYASELAGRLRAEGVDGPLLPEALALAVALWTDIDRSGSSELEWGLFATQVSSVADDLHPAGTAIAITVDPAALGDEQDCLTAARALIDAAAHVLQAAGNIADQPRRWQYAHAAVALRTALDHLP